MEGLLELDACRLRTKKCDSQLLQTPYSGKNGWQPIQINASGPTLLMALNMASELVLIMVKLAPAQLRLCSRQRSNHKWFVNT